MNYFDVVNGLCDSTRTNEYRYYKCSKNTCDKVSQPANDTIHIPKFFPENYDKILIRFHLKTILPIRIRC